MGYLIKENSDGTASVLLIGSTPACEQRGAELWAKGDHGPLVVMCDQRGRMRAFAGDHDDRLKGLAASRKAQEKAQEVRNAESALAAQAVAKRNADNALAKAKDAAAAATESFSQAQAEKEAAEQAAKPEPEPAPATKKTAKRKNSL